MNTTEEAREYFKPLTYEDITEENFNLLVSMLEEKFKKWNKKIEENRASSNPHSGYLFKISPKTVYNPKVYYDDRFCAFIKVICDNYSEREGISFNSDGFIGFAGWSDSTNVQPFLDVFEKWVDILKAHKRVECHLDTPLKSIKHYNPDIFVGEFPQNPIEGTMVIKDGIPYIYYGSWKSLQPTEEKLLKIIDIVNSSENCLLKQRLLEVL